MDLFDSNSPFLFSDQKHEDSRLILAGNIVEPFGDDDLPDSTRVLHVEANGAGFVASLEWPDRLHLRRLVVPDELAPPPSKSPFARYRIERTGLSSFRLFPACADRFVEHSLHSSEIAEAARSALPAADAASFCERIERTFGSGPISVDNLDLLLSVQDYSQPQWRFVYEAFDWLRWRRSGMEADVAHLAAFSDKIGEKMYGDPCFCLSIREIANDMKFGRNVLAHHLSGFFDLPDIRRWVSIVDRSVSAKIEFDAERFLWDRARMLFAFWNSAYAQRGPGLDGPVDGDSDKLKRLYGFFERHGVFRRAPGDMFKAKEQPLVLDLACYHEELLENLLRKLGELSSDQRSRPCIESFESLCIEKLSASELVVINHSFDSALEAIVEPLDGMARWTAACSNGQFQLSDKNRGMPVLLVRRAHFWTVRELSSLLAGVYIRREFAQGETFPKLVIEGDFRTWSRSCKIVRKATADGIYCSVSHSQLRVPASVPEHRRPFLENLLSAMSFSKMRMARVFCDFIERGDPLSMIKLVAPGTELLPRFGSIHELINSRHQLPLAESIFVPRHTLSTFDELYFFFVSTCGCVLLEAETLEEVKPLFA